MEEEEEEEAERRESGREGEERFGQQGKKDKPEEFSTVKLVGENGVGQERDGKGDLLVVPVSAGSGLTDTQVQEPGADRTGNRNKIQS